MEPGIQQGRNQVHGGSKGASQGSFWVYGYACNNLTLLLFGSNIPQRNYNKIFTDVMDALICCVGVVGLC